MITASISLLTFMSCSSGSSTVFQWFQNLTTIAGLFTWSAVCVAYIRFHRGLRDQGVDRDTLDFKGPFQPYCAWIALAFFSVIIVFNGFDSWSPEFNVTNFLTAYLGIPIFFGLYIFWKVFKGTKLIPTWEIDIYSGKSALDSIQWPEKEPSNIFEKFWYWLA
jgi:amino acid transporter